MGQPRVDRDPARPAASLPSRTRSGPRCGPRGYPPFPGLPDRACTISANTRSAPQRARLALVAGGSRPVRRRAPPPPRPHPPPSRQSHPMSTLGLRARPRSIDATRRSGLPAGRAARRGSPPARAAAAVAPVEAAMFGPPARAPRALPGRGADARSHSARGTSRPSSAPRRSGAPAAERRVPRARTCDDRRTARCTAGSRRGAVEQLPALASSNPPRRPRSIGNAVDPPFTDAHASAADAGHEYLGAHSLAGRWCGNVRWSTTARPRTRRHPSHPRWSAVDPRQGSLISPRLLRHVGHQVPLVLRAQHRPSAAVSSAAPPPSSVAAGPLARSAGRWTP
jgi:hypothetical protein